MSTVSRWKAAGWHFALSAVIVSATFAAALELWYPRPLLQAAGGERLLSVLAGIDIVIGPLVTLMIFHTAGKSLRAMKFDLVVVGLLQLAVLAYGVRALFVARPVFLVLAIDRFEVVTPVDIAPGDLAGAPAGFRVLSLTGPRLVAAELPSGVEERNNLLFSAINGGPDLAFLPKYYRPYPGTAGQALGRARPVPELLMRHPEARPELERSALGNPLERLRYFPVRGRRMNFAALIEPSSGAVLGYALVDPW